MTAYLKIVMLNLAISGRNTQET